jgi:hypothetical protein
MAKRQGGARPPVRPGKTTEAPDASVAAIRRIGALVAVAGSLILIGGVFLPWLSYSGGGRLSGWNVYQNHVNAGGNGFVVTRMFAADTFSVFITGFTILIAGILVILATLWILGLARRNRLGVRRLEGHVAFPALQLATLTLGLAIVNLVTVLAGDHQRPVDAEPGLFVVLAGGLVLCLGMFTAVRTRPG